MAQPLFINRTDLVRNSIIDGNLDTNKFIYFIKISQTIHIQNYLGTELYQEFEGMITAGTLTEVLNPNHYKLMIDYIQPMLIWFAQVDYIPFAAYQIKNGGVFKHRSENSESASIKICFQNIILIVMTILIQVKRHFLMDGFYELQKIF